MEGPSSPGRWQAGPQPSLRGVSVGHGAGQTAASLARPSAEQAFPRAAGEQTGPQSSSDHGRLMALTNNAVTTGWRGTFAAPGSPSCQGTQHRDTGHGSGASSRLPTPWQVLLRPADVDVAQEAGDDAQLKRLTSHLKDLA